MILNRFFTAAPFVCPSILHATTGRCCKTQAHMAGKTSPVQDIHVDVLTTRAFNVAPHHECVYPNPNPT